MTTPETSRSPDPSTLTPDEKYHLITRNLQVRLRGESGHLLECLIIILITGNFR